MSRLKNAYSTCMECGGTKMKKGGWIQKAVSKNPGSFTKQAQSAGMSVSGFRNKVLANKGDYSSTTVKRANLAKTLSKLKKAGDGVEIETSTKRPFTPNPVVKKSTDIGSKGPIERNPIKAASNNSTENSDWWDVEIWDKAQAENKAREEANAIEQATEKPTAQIKGLVKGGTEKVAAYQRMLRSKGFDIAVDGAWGKNTQAAYEKYMKSTKKASPAKKAWTWTEEDWDKSAGTTPTTSDGLPSVSLPSSSGIKSPGVKRKMDIKKLLSDETLPSVNLPKSTGIKPKMMMGGGIPGVNGSVIGPAVPMSKTGQSFPRRNAGTSKLAKFKKK